MKNPCPGRPGRRPRAHITLCLALTLLVVYLPVVPAAGAAASDAASATISSPTTFEEFPSNPVSFAGTAADAAGVSDARWDIQDINTNEWYHSDGTWGPFVSYLTALQTKGSISTTWTASVSNLAPGAYTLRVETYGEDGSTSPAATRSFGVASSGPDPAFLTLLFGRNMMQPATASCTPLPGSVPLTQVAKDLQARGLTATGAVVIDRTHATTEDCYDGSLYSSWSDIANLTDNSGWTYVSAGLTHDNITTMTPQQQYDDSCGSLPVLEKHGHPEAVGMFAYGDNEYNSAVQTKVVETCFDFGRTYRGGRNLESYTNAPWFQLTNSILGGSCNDPSQSCASVVPGTLYANPQEIANLFHVGPGEWSVVQMYRFVTGSNSTGPLTWDCTSANWQDHWTSKTEAYCYNDFLSALDQIPSGVTVTDPATVAAVWGRSVSSNS